MTILFHLYDLDYKGCISCFACKTRGGKSYGRCAVADDLSPVLERVCGADALMLGSPVYFGAATGTMRSFMERLLFPYRTYTDPPGTLFPRSIPTGFIYTMNVTEDHMQEFGYPGHIEINRLSLESVFGNSESLCSFDTLQFEDYGKVVADRFDPHHKNQRRAEVFPEDCEKAFNMGARFASESPVA